MRSSFILLLALTFSMDTALGRYYGGRIGGSNSAIHQQSINPMMAVVAVEPSDQAAPSKQLLRGMFGKRRSDRSDQDRVANVIFLESPAGVGFSYSTDGDIRTNDDQTADENYAALKHFFDLYPEYVANEFYLIGESYSGFYVPMLATRVLKDKSINFKGLAIGNGFMSADAIYDTLPPFLYNHNLITEELWTDVVKCCDGNPTECDYFKMMKDNQTSCYNTTIAAISDYYDYGLDPYDIYYTCDVDTGSMRTYDSRVFLKRFAKVDSSKRRAANDDPDPNTCPVYNRTALYLNREDVQTALRVDPPVEWAMCNDAMGDDTVYVTQYEDMYPQFAEIFAATNPIRVLLYNGDTDTVCNSVANQRFSKSLGRKQLEPTRTWSYELTSPDVAGMLTRYDRLDYATVRGAGHQVPSSKPAQSLQLIGNFLKNRSYDEPLKI